MNTGRKAALQCDVATRRSGISARRVGPRPDRLTERYQNGILASPKPKKYLDKILLLDIISNGYYYQKKATLS